MLRPICAALIAGTCISAHAESLDIAVASDSARIEYAAPFQAANFGLNQYNIGFLFTDEDDAVASFGMLVSDEADAAAPGLEAGLGFKVYGASADSNGSLAVGLGGEVRYNAPQLSRLGVGVFAYYAPDILAFLDTDKFYEAGARVGYQILPEALIYLGYRKVEMGLNNGNDFVVDSGGHLGFRYGF